MSNEICDVCDKLQNTDPIMNVCADCMDGKDEPSYCDVCKKTTFTNCWDCCECHVNKFSRRTETQ